MKHIKKIGIVMVLILVTVLCIGCGSKVNEEKSNPSTENHSSQVEEETQATENPHTKDMLDTENNKAESIQDEIAKVEDKSREYENADWGSMGQQEMNQLTAQWYQLWDDELNSLWSRLSNELDAETKAEVLDEQRAWIDRKEKNVKGAGMAAFGGTPTNRKELIPIGKRYNTLD